MKKWSNIGASSLNLFFGAMLLLTSCNHAEKDDSEYVSSPILPDNSLRVGLYLSNDYGEIDSRDNALILSPDRYRLLAWMRDGKLHDFLGSYTIREIDSYFSNRGLFIKDQKGAEFLEFSLMDYSPPYLSIERGPRPLVLNEYGKPENPGPSSDHELVFIANVDIDKLMTLSTDELCEHLSAIKSKSDWNSRGCRIPFFGPLPADSIPKRNARYVVEDLASIK